MKNRKNIYDSLRLKMKNTGFIFEKEQKPHLQNREENELKFVHPQLIKKLELEGYNVRAKKFYIKPLSDKTDCEIGFVTGKSSPLIDNISFYKPNTFDTYDGKSAWINKGDDRALDFLLKSIQSYMKTPSKSIANKMNTFLFAWNPNRWEWDDLDESIEQFKSIGYVERRWSCGNSKSIRKGDRVFLIRLGQEPKGIMGSGYAKSSYYTAPHWDGTKNKTTNYIDIEFDILIDPKKNIILDKENLIKIDPQQIQKWFPQQSGISIKPELIDSLESTWFKFIIENSYINNSFISNDAITPIEETFQEGKSKEIIQTRYERNPQARKICLNYHGYSCKICNFNFKNFYGEIGEGFIHVHHINPIAAIGEEYEVNPLNDLIPVCPNCHAMIHSRRPAFTIEEIKKTIKKDC